MTPDQRLHDVQAELKRRGIQVRGLTLHPGVRAIPLSEVKAQVAELFAAFLDGRCKPVAEGDIDGRDPDDLLLSILTVGEQAANSDVFAASQAPA